MLPKAGSTEVSDFDCIIVRRPTHSRVHTVGKESKDTARTLYASLYGAEMEQDLMIAPPF